MAFIIARMAHMWRREYRKHHIDGASLMIDTAFTTSPLLKSRVFLYATEFFAGMSAMAVELGASRLLAPYFSSSQIIWTIIISTIMVAMSIGNVLGGRWADKDPNPGKLYRRLVIAGIWIAVIPFAGRYLIPVISVLVAAMAVYGFLAWASFICCFVLFVFPVVLLGTVTPSLTKYAVDNLTDNGRTVGMFIALNTIGSIIGTFLPTFVTIPAAGTAATFVIFSLVPIALGVVYFATVRRHGLLCGTSIAVALACGLFSGSYTFAFWDDTVIYEGESIYNYLQVKQTSTETALSTNVAFGVQSVKPRTGELTGMYYDYAMAGLYMAGLTSGEAQDFVGDDEIAAASSDADAIADDAVSDDSAPNAAVAASDALTSETAASAAAGDEVATCYVASSDAAAAAGDAAAGDDPVGLAPETEGGSVSVVAASCEATSTGDAAGDLATAGDAAAESDAAAELLSPGASGTGARQASVLVLGLGSGTFATQTLRYFSGVSVDGVEIDEKIVDLANVYFDMDPRVNAIVGDGRASLSQLGTYDLIMVDAYQDITIPFQMTTVEFFTLVREHLAEGGVMVINMNMRDPEPGGTNSYLCDTVAQVFPYVYTVVAKGQSNMELFATCNADALSTMSDALQASADSLPARFVQDSVEGNLTQVEGGNLILTDDKAPVEMLGMRSLDVMIEEELSYYRSVFETRGLDGLLAML